MALYLPYSPATIKWYLFLVIQGSLGTCLNTEILILYITLFYWYTPCHLMEKRRLLAAKQLQLSDYFISFPVNLQLPFINFLLKDLNSLSLTCSKQILCNSVENGCRHFAYNFIPQSIRSGEAKGH